MLDPIEHRRRQIENMNKAFSDNNEIEKAWKIGDEKQYQGATWVVGGFNAKGAPLWRKKKDGGSSTAPAQTPASKGSSSKVSIDETSIDRNEYDRMHAQAQSVDKNSRSLGLKIIEGNIKQVKSELEDTIKNRPGAKAKIADLQKKLTMFVSQKKATEDVINGAKSSSALTSFDEVKEGSKYKINGETYYVAVMKELKGLPFKAVPFVGLVKESDGSLAAKSGDEIDREIKNGDWEHVTEGKTPSAKQDTTDKKQTSKPTNEPSYLTSKQVHAALKTNEAKKSVGGVYPEDVKKLKEKGIELPPNSASFHFGSFSIDGWLFDKLLSLPEYNGKLKVTDVPGERYKYVSGDLKDIAAVADDYWNSSQRSILDRVKVAEQNAKQSTSKQDSGASNIIKLKDFNNVSADRLKRIQGFLQTKDPDNPNNQRILEDDGMDDDRLADLQAVAEKNANNYGLNDKTREYCKKWNLLALDEIHRRNKERKGANKSSFIQGISDKVEEATKDFISVDTTDPSDMKDTMEHIFDKMGLDNYVSVLRSRYRPVYRFSVDNDVCGESNRFDYPKKEISFDNFADCVNKCIAFAIIKNNNLTGADKQEVEKFFSESKTAPKWKFK